MIEFDNVGKSFGVTKAVDDLSLRIARGDFMVLIGASGSGKSTVLKMINRLVEHDSGSLRIDGQPVRSFQPESLRRRMGYAIQSVGLFPHWTVERNVAAVPALLHWAPERIAQRVTELLALLGLEPAQYRHRYPHELSGGQQQRVGVARALAAEPDVLLMDEPFGALDPLTRAALQQEMARIHRASGRTIVFVTHDIDEALALATRIALIDRGRLVQVGTPAELLREPATGFVADFMGRADAGLRLLALETVAQRMRPGEAASGEAIAASATLREALAAFVVRGIDRMAVVDADGVHCGAIHLSDLVHGTR